MDIGSDVKVYKKKDKLDKEHIPSWQGKIYKIKEITEKFGQRYYYLEGYTQNGRVAPLLRHEILLIK